MREQPWSMDGEQSAALEAAVTIEDRVDFDGLTVTKTDEGYSLSLPDLERTGLDDTALERVARANAAWVTNWYFWHDVAPPADSDRYAFLRYLEHVAPPDGGTSTVGDGSGRFDPDAVEDRYEALSDGLEREWGELLVSVDLAEDGYRRYEVRHVDDAAVPATELEDHVDTRDAREIGKFDARDRYRPLKTAPTLRTGWRFPALTSHEVIAVVETFYPATIANWHRDRNDELDVDHWEAAMGRQSGIYGVIATWNRGDGHEHVEWVAEACCDDSQCLKRREWQYDEDTALDADPGDGVMPCREPCSLVVSAARQWTKQEGEHERTYEFELTPSEKEQLESIVDAVADGRTGDIREADVYDDANRLRARFLRAKRFDDDGALCGVPTNPDEDQ